MDECLTVGQMKKLISKLPDDTKIYYERIEDVYFNEHGWVPKALKSDSWWNRAHFLDTEGRDTNDDLSEWIPALESFYNEDEKALKITAHY